MNITDVPKSILIDLLKKQEYTHDVLDFEIYLDSILISKDSRYVWKRIKIDSRIFRSVDDPNMDISISTDDIDISIDMSMTKYYNDMSSVRITNDGNDIFTRPMMLNISSSHDISEFIFRTTNDNYIKVAHEMSKGSNKTLIVIFHESLLV